MFILITITNLSNAASLFIQICWLQRLGKFILCPTTTRLALPFHSKRHWLDWPISRIHKKYDFHQSSHNICTQNIYNLAKSKNQCYSISHDIDWLWPNESVLKSRTTKQLAKWIQLFLSRGWIVCVWVLGASSELFLTAELSYHSLDSCA